MGGVCQDKSIRSQWPLKGGADDEDQATTSGPKIPRQVLSRSGEGGVFAGERGVRAAAVYLPRAAAPSERSRAQSVGVHAHPRRPTVHLLSNIRGHHARRGRETKGTVSKAINRLEKIGLIRVHNDGGTRRYLLRDPRLAVERLFELKEISLDELEDSNDLLEKMGLPLIEPKPTVVAFPVKKAAQGS